MAKAFGYERGAFNYVVGSILYNTIPMYVFGGGTLAFLEALQHSLNGSFVSAAFFYFTTKYLPPSSVEQVIIQILVGSLYAGFKWYIKTPRMGSRR